MGGPWKTLAQVNADGSWNGWSFWFEKGWIIDAMVMRKEYGTTSAGNAHGGGRSQVFQMRGDLTMEVEYCNHGHGGPGIGIINLFLNDGGTYKFGSPRRYGNYRRLDNKTMGGDYIIRVEAAGTRSCLTGLRFHYRQ